MEKPRNRRPLLLLAAVFFVPVLVAVFLYFSGAWRPAPGAGAHGELVQPPRPLPEAQLRLAAGSAAPATLLRDSWSLVYVGDGACDARCREALVDMRQVRLALDKDAVRVGRVFLYTGSCCAPGLLDTEHSGLIAADAGDPAAAALLAAFGEGAAQSGRIWVVDPLGNLMMSYPPGATARGMLKDLERLLKLSRIGAAPRRPGNGSLHG